MEVKVIMRAKKCRWSGSERFVSRNGVFEYCGKCDGLNNECPNYEVDVKKTVKNTAKIEHCFGRGWNLSCAKKCPQEGACFRAFLGTLCEKGILRERFENGRLVYEIGNG